MMKLRINPIVAEDLKNIKEYIAEDNEEMAVKTIQDIYARIENIQQFPYMGADLALTEQEIKFVTPIRYDYNTKIYKPLVHSSAHVHFGYEENIRVPTDKVLFPSAFVKLILQYFYYDVWKQKIMQGDFEDCFLERIEGEIIDEQY